MTTGGDDADEVVRPQPQPRRFGEWPLLAVLALSLVSLGIVAFGHFKRGSVLLACTVVLAGVLRAGLTSRTAGLLAVRSRTVDTAMLLVLGIGMLVLALVVPPLVKSG